MMKKILSVFFLACCSCIVMAQDNVIDEIVWVVGDDAILRSDIETQRLYNQNEGVRLDGDPYCVIPEQMAIQKLYLNQAKIDSITVNENQVIQSVDQWMNMAVNQIGSREKLEEYFGKKFSQIKDERKEMVREQQVERRGGAPHQLCHGAVMPAAFPPCVGRGSLTRRFCRVPAGPRRRFSPCKRLRSFAAGGEKLVDFPGVFR